MHNLKSQSKPLCCCLQTYHDWSRKLPMYKHLLHCVYYLVKHPLDIILWNSVAYSHWNSILSLPVTCRSVYKEADFHQPMLKQLNQIKNIEMYLFDRHLGHILFIKGRFKEGQTFSFNCVLIRKYYKLLWELNSEVADSVNSKERYLSCLCCCATHLFWGIVESLLELAA